jgi:hypothetical protein
LFKGIQACSAGLLDEKLTKESRLPNLCSFHRDKSFERHPRRGNGSGLTRFSATLLRMTDGCRFTKEVYKDLSGSNPNIQRPDLLNGSAVFTIQGAVEVPGNQKIGSSKQTLSTTKPIAKAVSLEYAKH